MKTNDRELSLHLAKAYLEGFLLHSNNTFMADMLSVAKSSIDFELELMTEWTAQPEIEEHW